MDKEMGRKTKGKVRPERPTNRHSKPQSIKKVEGRSNKRRPNEERETTLGGSLTVDKVI